MLQYNINECEIMSKKASTLASLGLAGMLTIFGAEAQAQQEQKTPQAGDIIFYYSEEDRVEGPEFRMFVSTKQDGQLREVDVDVDTLVPVTLQDGTKALAPSVAFISNFEVFKQEGFVSLSPIQQRLIERAKTNMTTDRKQVAFMLEHIRLAHGVEYDDVRAASIEAKRYFDLD